MTSTKETPRLGRLAFGVGLRRQHFDGILDVRAEVDFLEIISENFMAFGGRPREALRKALDRFPIVLHGVSLSIGGLDPLDGAYLEKLKTLIGLVRPPWFSDHLSYSSHWGVQHHDLLPLPFNEEAVRHVSERVRAVQSIAGVPFLLENPSYYVEMPGSEMTEAEFFREIVTRADCGVLLDVNNVYVNATNHGYDARDFIDQVPRERVLQYHIAGHDDSGELLIDTHGSHILPEVLDLYTYAIERVGPAWTLLEWDNNIPSLETLLAENRRVRRAAHGVSTRTRSFAARERR